MGLVYREDLKIDANDLDTACLRQPVLFDIYSQNLVVLAKYRDELKLSLDQTSARLDGIIREAASAEGKKITETMIQNEITRNLQYEDLQHKYLNACAEVEEMKAIKDAFLQRRDMLKLLTEQYISGYWGTVETKVVNSKAKERFVENIKERLKIVMKEDKKNGIT